ncbi:MAG: GNAT family N-acetyltransferase, partial [Frankia sp.]
DDARAIWMGAHDLATWQLVQETPWLPVPYSRVERQAVEALDDLPPAREVSFAVEEIATGDLVGTAYVTIFRAPHRTASIGVTLWPAARGRGLGTDVLRVVCRYLFEVRAMFRADIETLAVNTALRGAARRAGFVEEGVRREHAWVDGAFADVVVAGLLLPDWRAARSARGPDA